MSIIKVKTGGITADAITDALIADDVVGTEHLTANEVDTTALGADAVTAAQIADDAISEEHLDVTAITGHTAETSIADGDTLIIHDASASALRKMTKANFVSGVGGVNTPAFSARVSSGITLNDNTATDVVFQTEFFDVGSCYNNSNGIFTVPSGEGGKYCISTSCTFNDGQGNVSDMALYIGSTISSSFNSDEVARAEATSNGTLFTRFNLSYSTIISLSAGDTIKIQALADTNNSSSIALLHGTRNSVFSAFKIIE